MHTPNKIENKMGSNLNTFERLWDDFIASYKGKLIHDANIQGLSFSLAKLLLEESCLGWFTGTEMNARWLDKLHKESPQKADLIKEIITNDITLTEVVNNPVSNKVYKYLVPACAGGAGYALAKYIELSTWGTALTTIIPTGIIYSIVKGRMAAKNDRQKQADIDEYVRQLDKYKKAIEAVLLAE